MAVILDIDIPESCGECPVYSCGVCKVGQMAIKKDWERSEFCPMREVQATRRIMTSEALEAAGFET